jgi:hypothetical protein
VHPEIKLRLPCMTNFQSEPRSLCTQNERTKYIIWAAELCGGFHRGTWGAIIRQSDVMSELRLLGR